MSENKLNYNEIIQYVRKKLNCGADRITTDPYFSRNNWWPQPLDIQDKISSDHGFSVKFKEIEYEFNEEFNAILEIVRQKDPKNDSSEDIIMRTAEQIATALNIWDQIGVPIRRRGDILYRIWAPEQIIGGTPIIKACHIENFIHEAERKINSNKHTINNLMKKLENYKAFIIIITLIMFTLLIAATH
jgi:hypothetical protein